MAPDPLARRLEALRRRREAGARGPAPGPVVFGRGLPARRRPVPAGPPGSDPATGLASSGGEVVRTDGSGTVFRIECSEPAPGPAPEPGLLFFDLETTGLNALPLFLVGVMEWREETLAVRQYLARDYSEERGAIALFLADAARAGKLVSYNGKSYDLPYLRMRAATAGLAFGVDLPHRDLLHETRRAFGDLLPDCRLGTVEARLLGRGRIDDIPGALIPGVYHDFVRTGDAREILRVLGHNRLDLVSLAALLARLEES